MTTTESLRDPASAPWADRPAFMEVQFPVSKMSKESYKERKAVAGQTLTALGKWWGRKPLVLVRAAILGLLLPATDDPQRDRETFLALMTMDDEGLLARLKGSMSASVVHGRCTTTEQRTNFDIVGAKPKWKTSLSREERQQLQRLAFRRMSYDEKLEHCLRPEEIDGPSEAAWTRINEHLGTSASALPELVRELGQRRFGHTPRVGDAFSGGGSIPFEAARIGCDAYASDLNPVAALLTWGALNIVGGGAEVAREVKDAQRRVYEAVREQVDAWGIERNEQGWVADAYLYCVEAVDPTTGWSVPLAPSWLIAEKTNVIARLVPDAAHKRFEMEVLEGVSAAEMQQAREEGTAQGGIRCPVDAEGRWLPPTQRIATSMEQLRGPHGLRHWENDEVVPRPDEVLQERLYCIRWVDQAGTRHYCAPTDADLRREERVLALLRERFDEWQDKGYIPSAKIEPGQETTRLTRERGWTYWHQLFNPRQLLLNGLFAEKGGAETGANAVALLLVLGRIADTNSRLSRWQTGQGGGIGGTKSVSYNPALNPLENYAIRTVATAESTACIRISAGDSVGRCEIGLGDARGAADDADAWITDPGYADMINYEELSEFFLCWYQGRIKQLFPGWYTDSKRALAVAGKAEDFRTAMVECYRRFASLMPDNGFQIVMFTHQDAEVWSDMALILWAAGLRVSAAWTVATETPAGGVKEGNYVQGTVLLVLRKRLAEKRGDMADIYPELREEVERQMQTMLDLDPKDDPNFGDADYQLAAYAAALRVLTAYSSIDEIDVERELYRTRAKNEKSPLTGIIERAVKIASDYLVPDGIGRSVWRKLTPEERLYIKGVEVEAHGEYREGVYQEFARGFGVGEYRSMLGSGAANQARIKTPSEFKGRDLGGDGFGGTLLRKVLFAVYTTASHDEMDPRAARTYLKQEVPNYWDQRSQIAALLRYLANKPRTTAPALLDDEASEQDAPMAHWSKDAEAARLLLGSIENDSA